MSEDQGGDYIFLSVTEPVANPAEGTGFKEALGIGLNNTLQNMFVYLERKDRKHIFSTKEREAVGIVWNLMHREWVGLTENKIPSL